jgi:hypothetical protein
MSAKKTGRGVTPSSHFRSGKDSWSLPRSKELPTENPLVKYSIIAAEVGGLFEVGHTIWLAIGYLFKFCDLNVFRPAWHIESLELFGKQLFSERQKRRMPVV